MAKKPTHARMSEAVDNVIVDALENGQTVVTGTDREGKPIVETITPTAAMVGQAIRRLQQLGISQMGKSEHPVAQAVRRMKFKGKTIPTIDTDQEDAATG